MLFRRPFKVILPFQGPSQSYGNNQERSVLLRFIHPFSSAGCQACSFHWRSNLLSGQEKKAYSFGARQHQLESGLGVLTHPTEPISRLDFMRASTAEIQQLANDKKKVIKMQPLPLLWNVLGRKVDLPASLRAPTEALSRFV